MSKLTFSRKQFDVLTYLERNTDKKTHREIAEATGMSVGSVNRVRAALTEKGYVSESTVTEAGYAVLEP